MEHSLELQLLKRVLFLNSFPDECQQLARWESWPLADNKVATATGLCGNLLVVTFVDLSPWSLLTCGFSVFPSPAPVSYTHLTLPTT